MSKNNNVNPGSYQTAGREHTNGPDNGALRGEQKQRMSQKGKGTKSEIAGGMSAKAKKNHG